MQKIANLGNTGWELVSASFAKIDGEGAALPEYTSFFVHELPRVQLQHPHEMLYILECI